MIENLERLINVIDVKLAGLDRDLSWEQRRHEDGKLIDFFTETEGAKFREQGGGADGYSLRMASVNTSCTSGYRGLLRNWQNAARRRIERIKAGDK